MVIFKLLFGFMTHSVAIQADGFNNLSDMGSNLATLFGFKLAGKHPDSDHPYGHGRYEYIAGLTLLGGEPFERDNQIGLLPLLRKVKAKFPEKNIWCFTGFYYDTEIMEKMYPRWQCTREMLSYIDVLVDGRFEEDKKDLTLKFKGSSNQRTIDVQESLKEGKIVLHEFEETKM